MIRHQPHIDEVLVKVDASSIKNSPNGGLGACLCVCACVCACVCVCVCVCLCVCVFHRDVLLKKVLLFSFHSETLRLYGAVCSHGNNRVAHELTKHIDEKQLMYLIQAPYLSGKRVRVWNIKLDNGLFQRMVGESSFNSANSFIILLKSYGPLFIN